MTGLETERQAVISAGRTLREAWAATGEVWHDDGAMRFERDAVEPLQEQLTTTARVLERLAAVLASAERATP